MENRLRVVDSRTPTGAGSIALPQMLVDVLALSKERSRYDADGDRVFCHPSRGSGFRIDHRWKPALKRACEASGVVLPGGMRPMHDVWPRHLDHVRCSTTRWWRSRNACSASLPNLLPDSHHLR